MTSHFSYMSHQSHHIGLQIDLPIDKEVVLLDIGFTGSDPNHGTLPPLTAKT